MNIGKKEIGKSTFIIAEIGMNHNGDIELAKEIIKSAAECGCDAAKFQIFTAEKLVTKDAKTYGNDGHLPEYQQEMYKKYELTHGQYLELKKYCNSLGLEFFASVWDEENADMLEKLDGACFKLGSADITHIPLIKHIAKKNKPIIMSTGMATFEEIEEAVNAIKNEGNNQIVLLHCISGYPTKIEDSNLKFIQTLQRKFPFSIGFSDHTPGPFSSVAAVTLGAKVIEKHFTIDKNLEGVDHHLSMNPSEMKQMCDEIRLMEKALGDGTQHLTEKEKETREMARRSIIANVDINKDSIITEEMLVIKRPGTGLKPNKLNQVIGKVVNKNILKDSLISEEDLFSECQICKSNKTKLFHTITEDRYTKEKVSYYTCDECNVRFVFPQNWKKLEELYKNKFRDKISFKQHIVFRLPFSKRHENTFKFLENLEKGKLLDIGAGEGKFSWLMQKKGWKVTAIEPTTHYAEFARKTYNLKVENIFIDDFKTEEKFDLINFSAILEHLPDPLKALHRLKTLLNENGRIFIRVPHETSEWFASTHLFLFSKKSLKILFKNANLNIEKIEKIGKEYFILVK